jgi:anti-anti-sigma regulatory factor
VGQEPIVKRSGNDQRGIASHEDRDRARITFVASERGAWRVILRGVVDLTDVPRLSRTLGHALTEVDEVHVDVTGLHAIDSAGMRELLKAQAVAVRAGERGRYFGISSHH